MHNSVLVRYGEIGLKGLNRNYFENALVKNIKFCLEKNKVMFSEIVKARGRIIVHSRDDCSCLRHVFGIVSFSQAIMADLGDLANIILKIIKANKFKSFKINTHRLDKSIKKNSVEFNIELGNLVLKNKKNIRVDLSNPELEICIELIEGKSYVFTEKIKAFAGLPTGVEGNVIVLLEDKDSETAALLAMKRGCSIIPVAMKDIDLKKLNQFSNKELKLIKIKKIRDIDNVAEQYNALAVIVGYNLEKLKQLNIKTTLLAPMIGYDNRTLI